MLAVAKNRIVYVFLIAVLAVTVSAWRPHSNEVDAEMIEQARTAELDLRREQMHAGIGNWGKLAPKTGLFAYWKTPFLRQRAWKLAQANGVMYLGSSEPTEASEASARLGQRNRQAYHYFASVIFPGDGRKNRFGLANSMGLEKDRIARLVWKQNAITKKVQLIDISEYPYLEEVKYPLQKVEDVLTSLKSLNEPFEGSAEPLAKVEASMKKVLRPVG